MSVSVEGQISGDFGEILVRYLLARRGVETIQAKTEGFDLLAVDPKGLLFPKNRKIGISVKGRYLKTEDEISETVGIDPEKIEKMSKIWGVTAYIAVVAGHVFSTLYVFLLPFKHWRDFTGRARREGVISISSLQHDESGRVIILAKPHYA